MKRRIATFTLGCIITCTITTVHADTSTNESKAASASVDNDANATDSDLKHEASDAARHGDLKSAIAAYERLVNRNPHSVPFRLTLADALRNDRQWERAVSEYQTVLKKDPNNVEAILGIGTIRRWQGNVDEAKHYYQQARTLDPQNPDALLGLAATDAINHDLVSADALYTQAEKKWPENSTVMQDAYNFRRQRNPKLYLFLESGLSFETRQAGAVIPFVMKEEVGVEGQDETSFAPQLGHEKIYTRSDKRIFYTHYIGLNHLVDVSARHSTYEYFVPDSSLGFTAIDSYEEYRLRYTAPISLDQIISARYTARPTTLKLSHDSFTAHKFEVEINSHWTPRFFTQIGSGWLRDLDSNAVNITQLTNRVLFKAGFQWDATNRLSLGAKYITNPDLDNTMRATSIAQGSYSLTDVWSILGRYRLDDYKSGSNQSGYYLAARYVPNSHWWSEAGLKYEKRGPDNGTYGLVSINYRF